MLVVKVTQTGQASFSAARVALMGRQRGRSGPLDAHTPPTFSSSHSSSPWDKASVSGPAGPLYPEPLPSHPLPGIFYLGPNPPTVIPCSILGNPRYSPTFHIPPLQAVVHLLPSWWEACWPSTPF